MNKTNLSEITKISATDNSSIYDNGITEKLNRYKMLTVIKDCIVNGNFCKKLISDEYTAKDLIQHFIRQVDENYNYRSDTRTLEFDQSRFSSFLIVHIATVNADIKNQTYECFVYMPTDMSKKIRLIITPEIDKNVDNKYALMSDAVVSLLEQNTNLRLDRDTVSRLLTLCDEAIHMPDINLGKKYCNANKAINGIKKTLSYGKYSINYTKEYNESLRSEELKKEIRQTIDDFVREQPIVQQENTEESLSSELTKLAGCCAYNTIALIFGYYLSSLFYKPYCRNALSYEEGVFPLKNRYVLNLYCTSKQSNGLYSIVRKLNNIFYDILIPTNQ